MSDARNESPGPVSPVPVRALVREASQALARGEVGEAERLARAALAAAPGDPVAAQALGHALLRQGRPGEALRPLREAADAGDDAATRTLLGRALAAAGKPGEALDELGRAAAHRPAFPLAFLELGELLGEAGRFDEARAALETGLALAPDAVVLQVALGRLHLRRGERPAARACFEAAHAAAPDRRDALAGLARLAALGGDYAAAAGLYRQVLALKPHDPATHLDLGRCLLELGEREAGEDLLRSAARAAPELAGLALRALSAAAHGRLFLRPSDAIRFLGLSAAQAPGLPG
jgi:tetratricopeptide (TPR) repeat protein